MLTAHGVTHAGTIRKINEDALLSDLGLRLFVVADGMGGHNAGEVASRLAIEAVQGFLTKTQDRDDFTWPYGINPQLSYDANRLMTSLKLANRQVFKAAENHDEYTGMGTTIVAALVDQDRVIYAGIGDSRIYSFLDGTLRQLTHDDSWVATVLARQEGLKEKSLSDHPMRHVLTNVIGAREQTDMEIGEHQFGEGEMLLLCSDGLHGAIDDPTIARILSGARSVEDAAQQLLQSALDHNGSDNITALIVRYGG